MRESPAAFQQWRIRILGTFLLFGVLCGSWLSRIPAMQQSLSLSPGWLGLALASPSVGALLVSALMPRLQARWGSAALTRAGALAWTLTLAIPAAAPGFGWLAAALCWFGIASGVLNIAMNTQGQALEAASGRTLMSSFHAMFGLGAMLGSAGGALAAYLGAPPFLHLAIAAAMLMPAAWWTTAGLVTQPQPAASSNKGAEEPKPRLWGLSALAICVLGGEGSMADWAGVYLKTVAGAGPATAALGYTIYSIALTGGRLVGDRLVTRFGPARLVGGGCLLAGVALAWALWMGGLVPAFIAFVCMGLGYAGAYPTITSEAARSTEPKPHLGIAAIAATAYVSFLAGPPLLGFIAEGVGLAGALGVIAALNLIGAALSSQIFTRRR